MNASTVVVLVALWGEVGHRVGYGDPGYFVKFFRRTHGATPLGWRRAGRP
jgi:AraC family transcriptional activator of pobA